MTLTLSACIEGLWYLICVYYATKSVYTTNLTGFTLKSEYFGAQISLKLLLSKVTMLFAHLWLFGFTVHMLIAHVRALTWCTHDNNPTHTRCPLNIAAMLYMSCVAYL